MAYVPPSTDRNPLGQWFEVIEPTAAKLRAFFKAGIVVIASSDGMSFRAERPLPGDWVPPDVDGHEGG